jgi:hypothetical protein
MPLCMKTLHAHLKKDHKLKHWGRLQYGLFLKGAGLDMEDALVFFESHFARAMTHDEFMKSYSYNFRHMYGKEGARKNYTPYSCMKIILGPPPQPGAVHGCPYRHATDTQLAAMLSSLRIANEEVKDIVQLAKGGGHYQLACQRHFDLAHPDHAMVLAETREGDAAANHPNGWFQASMQYHRRKKNPNAANAAAVMTPSSTPSSQSQSYVSQAKKMTAVASPTEVITSHENSMDDDDLIAAAESQMRADEHSRAAISSSSNKRQHEEEEVDEAAMEAMMEG